MWVLLVLTSRYVVKADSERLILGTSLGFSPPLPLPLLAPLLVDCMAVPSAILGPALFCISLLGRSTSLILPKWMWS